MSDDSSDDRGPDPTNPYGRRPDPNEQPSAAQRREHPAGSPAGGSTWGRPGPYQGQAERTVARRSGAGSAFAVALVATVVGVAVSLGASYFVAHHRLGSLVARQNISIAGLTVWPTGPGQRVDGVPVLRLDTTNFVIAYAIAGVALLALLWWAAGSASAGRAAFTMFLAGWGAAVVAGAVALVIAFLVATDRSQLGVLVSGALNAGAAWGLRIGWLVGLVAAIGQATRRRDV